MVKEYSFPELGYFSAGQIHQIAAVMSGKTYMNFKVGGANHAGNCTLIVMTDYAATKDAIKNFFLHAALIYLLKNTEV